MKFIASIRTFASSLFHRARVEREIDEELRAHIESRAADLERSGLPLAEAERQAKIEFGGYEAAKEESREAVGISFLESILGDIRFGLRMLRKAPGFTAIAIVTLALGIGASTAIFSVVYSVLLRPLPYPGSSRMVLIREEYPESSPMLSSWRDFLDWRSQNNAFQQMVGFQSRSFYIPGAGQALESPAPLKWDSQGNLQFGAGGPPRRVFGLWVSRGFFRFFGARPVLGRAFDDADQKIGAPPVVILSNRIWQNDFHSDPHVIGRVVTVYGVFYDGSSPNTAELSRTFTIVGVLPPGFGIPGPLNLDLYLPIGQEMPVDVSRAARGTFAFAKLPQGTSIGQAQAEMDTIMSRLGQEYPRSDKNERAVLTPMKQWAVGGASEDLTLLLAAVGLVLLLGCANVAHMALARGIGRQHEFAMRAALGAGRPRLVRQLLAEHALLGLLGGAVGVVLAAAGIPFLLRMHPQFVYRLDRSHIDGAVLLFAIGVSLLSAVLFGLFPALHTRLSALSSSLRNGGLGGGAPRGRGLRSALVVVEVALALILTTGAGLLLRSLSRAMSVNPGFRPHHLFEFLVGAPALPEHRAPAAALSFVGEGLARIRSLPGVGSAAATNSPPLGGRLWTTTSPYALGPTPPGPRAPWAAVGDVTASYFRTIGARLIAGRPFSKSDVSTSAPVAIVNESLARTISLKGDVIGRQIFLKNVFPQRPLRVVGVVGDVKQRSSLALPAMPEVYIPMPPYSAQLVWMVVRTSVDPASTERPAIQAIRAVNPDQFVSHVQTFHDLISSGLSDRRFLASLLGLFGGLALVLAVVGVWGAMSYTVDQRRHEIGVRAAMGAQPRDILRLVLGQGMLLATIGIALGIGGAFASARLISGELFEVKATDPLTLAGVALLIAIVALAACWIPARRAARLDPMTVLRQE